MRIQELERMVGSDRATIRYYEKEGLITPNRSENGYRDYTEENAEELKRILLLRQLGVSIHTITRLQQGSVDFRQVLEDQIRTLTRQIGENKRARAVCETMRDDAVAYSSLDAAHYLKLMQCISIDDEAAPKGDFRENLPKEVHPWRRWFARWIDYAALGAVMSFLIIVVLRIRPVPGDFMNIVLAICYGFLFVPLEAFMLSKWGTTPGKYAMGIRLESIQGGRLTYLEALERAWSVLKDGTCFGIPFLELWQTAQRYSQLTGRSLRRFARREDIQDPEDMPWDGATEIIYQPQTRKRGVALAGILAVVIAINIYSGIDGVRPKHRGSELTIAQFVENYNDLADILHPDGNFLGKLQPDGSRMPLPDNVIDLGMSGQLSPETPEEYTYTTSDGRIQSISVIREWTDVRYNTPMSNADTTYLAVTILLGQKGFGLRDLDEFAKQMDENSNTPEGTIIYGDIEIRWSIAYENLIWAADGTFYANPDNDEPNWLRYTYTVILH